MAEPNSGFMVQLGSIGAAIVSALTVIAFWTRLSDRITKADGKADVALQEAAESKNENDSLREAIGEVRRDMDTLIDKRSREYGEGLAALRQHITDVAFFGRDNFVRKEDFKDAIQQMKEGQERIEEKIDDVRDRLPNAGKHS